MCDQLFSLADIFFNNNSVFFLRVILFLNYSTGLYSILILKNNINQKIKIKIQVQIIVLQKNIDFVFICCYIVNFRQNMYEYFEVQQHETYVLRVWTTYRVYFMI